MRTYASHIESGAYVDHTYLKSGGPLIDWSDPVSEKVWANFILTGRNRWAYDGYYYETPDTYYPTGENRYHRLVSAYITTKLIAAGGKYTAARELGLAMLDVMCRQQTDGFFPTLAGCTWLSEDYGIGPGFFAPGSTPTGALDARRHRASRAGFSSDCRRTLEFLCRRIRARRRSERRPCCPDYCT